MRFGGEAPGRRAHSHRGMDAMRVLGSPPPRTVINALPQECGGTLKLCLPAPCCCWSDRCPQHHTVRKLAHRDHTPQGNEQLSGKSDNHGRLAGALGGPRMIPLHERALLLEAQEAPG